MIHLAKHIELLLLNNDCVIIPRFGGFVTHYSPAQYIEKENAIRPPYRAIGFNSQLKINDGILAESYMNFYGINFNEAIKRIDKEVDELLSIIHDEGRISLSNIGELRYNIHGSYEFTPFNNKLISPDLYGLDIVPVKELTTLYSSIEAQEIAIPIQDKVEKDEDHSSYTIHLNRTFARSLVAAATFIIFMFVFSAPITNINISPYNKAELLPDEWVNKLKNNETLKNVTIGEQTKKTADAKTKKNLIKNKVTHTDEIQGGKKDIRNKQSINDEKYQLIVASRISRKSASELVEKLKCEGYKNAQTLISGKMVRVSIEYTSNKQTAYNLVNKLSKTTKYKNLWIMEDYTSSIK